MADDTDSPRAARMFEAVQGLERRLGRRVTLDELGAWVAEREGNRGEPYAGSVVRRWIKGLSEPRTTAAWRALADTLGVEPGWLAFGAAAAPASATQAPDAPRHGPHLPASVATVVPVEGASPHAKAKAAKAGTTAQRGGRRRA